MPTKLNVETEPLLEPLASSIVDSTPHHVIPQELGEPTSPRTTNQQLTIDPDLRAYISTVILFVINLLNYMDRFTIAANLKEIQTTYHIDDSNSAAGLIQTIFIVGYMVTSPVFGYLGDRYPRKIIMSVGILFWAAMTLCGSFVPDNMFWLFVVIRGLVGIGEASYSTISCTIIGDLFIGNRRTQMLMLFYFAVPVGSGLGYIAGKGIADAFNDWRWALRMTPGVGVLSVICIMTIIKEPSRGQAETGNHTISSQNYTEDLKALIKNKTYMLTTFGFTSIAWVVGALALWMVKLMELVYEINGKSTTNVSFIFGAITCAAGFGGVTLGTMGAQFYRRYNPRADPLVCAFGNLFAAPVLFIGFIMARQDVTLAWICVFFGELGLFLNWALVPDMLMQVLIPVRRSTGNGMQMLSSHLLGMHSAQSLLDFLNHHLHIGHRGGFFLASSLFVEEDKHKMQTTLKHYQELEDSRKQNDGYQSNNIGSPNGSTVCEPDVII